MSKSKIEFLGYLDEMPMISPNLAPILVSIKANDLVVPGNINQQPQTSSFNIDGWLVSAHHIWSCLDP